MSMPGGRMAKTCDYLVTGGAGFIGSNIVRELVRRGCSVRVLDNLATGRMENLAGLEKRIRFLRGDVRDEDAVRRAVRGVRFVIHAAALPSVVRSVEDPVESNQVNACGTLRMLMASRDACVERFVFSSSSSVYGGNPRLPKREDMLPEPLSPYAVQKLTSEHYCRIFHGLYGLKTFCLRYFNVYGPRQDPASQYAAVIPRFISALRAGRRPVVYGDGLQTRDFTFVEDVVAANLRCCEVDGDAAGRVFNIACGRRISLLKLLNILSDLLGTSVAPRHEPPRPGDVRHSQADISLARKILGWSPGTSLEKGLEKTVEYFCSPPEAQGHA